MSSSGESEEVSDTIEMLARRSDLRARYRMERELGRLKEDLRRREEREAAAKAPSTREMRAEMKNKIGEHLDAMVEIKGDQTSGSGFVVEADGKTWIYCAASTLSGNSKLEITQSGGGKLEGFGAFELASGTNLARLELKEPPEKKLTEKSLKRLMQAYYGMVKCIDDNVGRILSALRNNGILDRTIVVFTSDHGDLCGEHRKLNKGVPHEASAKIPFIIYFPKKIKAGTVIDQVLTCVDFLPTVLEKTACNFCWQGHFCFRL